MIILHASPNYRFINLDQDGQVYSFAPRISDGHHHVLLIVNKTKFFNIIKFLSFFQLYPSSSRRIYIPILPITAGSVSITIEGITGVRRAIVTKTMNVIVRFIIL